MSGSRGPLSKPNAVRRGVKPAKVYLPAEGYRGPIPDWPLAEGTRGEGERWLRLWRTPQAAQWVRMGIEPVIARYARLAIIAERSEGATSLGLANIKSEVRQLETVLGLSPAALRRLEWEIVEDDVEQYRSAAPTRRNLRAVDPPDGAS